MNSVLIARTISLLLVPPTISVAAFTLLFFESPDGSFSAIQWFIASLFAGGLQIVFVLWLRMKKKLRAYDEPHRSGRTLPYVVSSSLTLCGSVILILMNTPWYASALMVCLTINMLVLLGINRFYKLSAHMMGIAVPAVFFYPVYGSILLFSFPLIVLTGWARVKTQAHTFAEVVAGIVVGVLCTAAQLPFLHS